MSTRARNAGDLDQDLKALGIPVISVILYMPRAEPSAPSVPAPVRKVTVQYAPEITALERQTGDAYVAAYDWDAPVVLADPVAP